MNRLARAFLRITGFVFLATTVICCKREWTWIGIGGTSYIDCGVKPPHVALCSTDTGQVFTCVIDDSASTITCSPTYMRVAPEHP